VTSFEILIYDGTDELDVFGPFEVLSGARLDVRLVTVEPRERVATSGNALIVPHGELGDPDLLLVPGGGWNSRPPVGTWAEAQRGVIPAALAARHAAGGRLGSVCTGAMLLAEAGILTGRPATTHHTAHADLAASGAELIADARVVDDGDIVTAAGVTSGIDLALWLVERERGTAVAEAVATEIEHTWNRTVWTRPST
jgi:transcriptional regulator GlxA family with amidase domain